MPKNRSTWGILVVILLALPLVVACGGGDDNTQPTNTPTRPAVTVGADPTQTPVGSGGQTAPYNDKKDVFIPPTQFGSITVPLKTGDVLKVEIKVRSTVVGAGDTQGQNRGDAGIIMAINDPLGAQLLITEQVVEHKDEVTADLDGEHVIAFQNPFPLAAMIVTTTYSVNQ